MRLPPIWLVLATLTVTATLGWADEPKPSLDRVRRGKIRSFPQPSAEDLALIDQSFRTLKRGLVPLPGWPDIEAFDDIPLLFLTEENEYVIDHPAPPETHFLVPAPMGFVMKVYGLETKRDCNVSTTRPVFGAPTVVKGSRACTGETSSEWMFDYIRRAYRTYLYRHSELLKISRLNLPFPDPNETWKASFPFPYDDPEVIRAVRELGGILNTTFWSTDPTRTFEALEHYYSARQKLDEILEAHSEQYSAADFFRYYTWAEGIPHYAAYATIEFVSRGPRTPATITDRFEDFVPFNTFLRNDLRSIYQTFLEPSDEPLTLEDLALIGALTAGTVDKLVPDWKPLAIERDVWLEDLMARARLEAH